MVVFTLLLKMVCYNMPHVENPMNFYFSYLVNTFQNFRELLTFLFVCLFVYLLSLLLFFVHVLFNHFDISFCWLLSISKTCFYKMIHHF